MSTNHDSDDGVRFSIIIHPFKAAGSSAKLAVTIETGQRITPQDFMTTLAAIYPIVFRDMDLYQVLMGTLSSDEEVRFGSMGSASKATGDKCLIKNPETGELMLGWDEYMFSLFTTDPREDAVVESLHSSTGIKSIEISRVSHAIKLDGLDFPHIDPDTSMVRTDCMETYDGPMRIPNSHAPDGTVMCANCDKPDSECPLSGAVGTYTKGGEDDPDIKYLEFKKDMGDRNELLIAMTQGLARISLVKFRDAMVAKRLSAKIKHIIDSSDDEGSVAEAIAEAVAKAKQEKSDPTEAVTKSIEQMKIAIEKMGAKTTSSHAAQAAAQGIIDPNRPIRFEDQADILSDLLSFLDGEDEDEVA